MTRIAYVTAGTVGAGHFVRGAAIARAFARCGARVEYRIFGPRIDFPCTRDYPYVEVELSHEALIDPQRARSSPLANALDTFAPELLLVDLFWAPLRYILPLAGVEAWLLLRKTPREWLRGPPRAPFDPGQYRRILAIEPLELTGIEPIDPIVIANPDEAHPRGSLDAKIAVVHAGEAGELAQLINTLSDSERARACSFDLRAAEARFPLALWLGDAELIVTAAGYNSYWETRWFQRDDRTRFVPLARRIDDQSWRVKSCGGYVMKANGADTLVRQIVGAVKRAGDQA